MNVEQQSRKTISKCLSRSASCKTSGKAQLQRELQGKHSWKEYSSSVLSTSVFAEKHRTRQTEVGLKKIIINKLWGKKRCLTQIEHKELREKSCGKRCHCLQGPYRAAPDTDAPAAEAAGCVGASATPLHRGQDISHETPSYDALILCISFFCFPLGHR